MPPKKDYTSGLTALGKKSEYPASPSRKILESFPNPHPGADYTVEFDCPEFTRVCTVTGQPDFGRFEIEYCPNKLCLESKSLKLYLFSFRNEDAFWEDITNRIANDIFAVLAPQWLKVTGYMNPRGGIGIKTVAKRGEG